MNSIKKICSQLATIIERNAQHDGSGEAKMWVQVIKLAFLDIANTSPGLSRSAIAFFNSDRLSVVCDYAGLDVDYVRGLFKKHVPQ